MLISLYFGIHVKCNHERVSVTIMQRKGKLKIYRTKIYLRYAAL